MAGLPVHPTPPRYSNWRGQSLFYAPGKTRWRLGSAPIHPLAPGLRRVKSRREFGETWRWSVPSKLVHVIEQRDVGFESREPSE